MLSDDNSFTQLALEDQPLEKLVSRIYLRLLAREPNDAERKTFVDLLSTGYDQRRVDAPLVTRERLPRGLVSWSNHLAPEANVIKTELEKAVRQGDPATRRLQADWRERMEDMLWALLNSPEFVHLP